MERRTLLKAGLVAPAAAVLPGTVSPAEAAPRVSTTLTTGLDTPWNIAFLPTGDALVTQRDSGLITRVSRHGGRTTVGHVPGVEADGEGGLLGLALHPNFSSNRLIYTYYTSARDNRIVRLRYSGGRLSGARAILTGIPKNTIHNGGGLAFGGGGNLYVSVGDAGSAENAQNRNSRSGKILRITTSGRAAPGNPFGNRVWSYGHRNPEGITFGPDGRLWSSEFGQNTYDELNQIVKGANYGWPRREGKDGPGGYRDPLAQWSTDQCSPSGIAVLRGRAWLGALRGECLWSVPLSGPDRGQKTRYFFQRFGRIRAVAAAPDGSLWIGTSNRDGRGTPAGADDRIIRILL
jgi:glucose/arabinose dehydrogenase